MESPSLFELISSFGGETTCKHALGTSADHNDLDECPCEQSQSQLLSRNCLAMNASDDKCRTCPCTDNTVHLHFSVSLFLNNNLNIHRRVVKQKAASDLALLVLLPPFPKSYVNLHLLRIPLDLSADDSHSFTEQK
jgi:hypothetical protein